MRTYTPLVYFRAVEKGAHVPTYPACFESDHPDQLYCRVLPDVAFALPGAESRNIFATLATQPVGRGQVAPMPHRRVRHPDDPPLNLRAIRGYP